MYHFGTAEAAGGRRQGLVLKPDFRPDVTKALQVLVSRPSADRAAARLEHLGCAKARHQRAEHRILN